MYYSDDDSDGSDDLDVELELGTDNNPDRQSDRVVPGDPTDGNDSAELGHVCAERWKANAYDSKKGIFSCFEESGLFVSVCRHGLLIICCDMVESGEL